MRNRAVTGLVVAAALVVAGAGMLACAEEAAKRPDLTGQWRLDPKRSDTMKPPGDAQQRGSRGGGSGGGPRAVAVAASAAAAAAAAASAAAPRAVAVAASAAGPRARGRTARRRAAPAARRHARCPS